MSKDELPMLILPKHNRDPLVKTQLKCLNLEKWMADSESVRRNTLRRVTGKFCKKSTVNPKKSTEKPSRSTTLNIQNFTSWKSKTDWGRQN